MKARNLLVLLIAAVLLGVWAFRSVDSTRQASQPARMGSLVFDDLPVNDVTAIIITKSDTNLTVKRMDDQWVVAERFNYPAKFDKVAETLMDLRELKIGQIVPGTRDNPGEFKLLPPDSADAAADRTATRLELHDTQDNLLARLLIGKHFNTQPPAGSRQNMMFGDGAYPSGQYVGLPDGSGALVSKTLDRMIEPATSWLRDEFINVAAADIEEISVSGPERDLINVRRDQETKQLVLVDLNDSEGTADSTKLGQLAGALNYLSFQDVANPKFKPEDTGLDQPVVFTARAADGSVYTLNIGGVVSSNSTDRYLTVRVGFSPPPTPEQVSAQEDDSDAESDKAGKEKSAADKTAAAEMKARELNKSLSPWIYVLRSYRLDNLLLTRDKLITPPAEEEEPAATESEEPVATESD